MNLLRRSREKAADFAYGRGTDRTYAPGEAGIPADYWMWGAEPSGYTPDEFGNYILTSNPVFACVTQRSAYLSSLPLRLYKFTGKPALMNIPRARSQGEALLQALQEKLYTRLAGKSEVKNAIKRLAQATSREDVELAKRQMGMEEIVEGPAYELLQYVNDFWHQNRLMRMTSMAKDLWGQNYWVINRGPTTRGKPEEIWWVKPTQMRPVPHPDNYISHYEFDPLSGGEPIIFFPWEVVRIYNPNPLDEFQALSPLHSSAMFADHEIASMESNMNLHTSGLHPGAIVTPKNGLIWEKGQARQIEEDINNRLGGVDKAHRWGTFRHEVTIHQAGITPKDSEFLGGMDYDIEAVARAYDWPIDLLAGKRTYENVEQAFKRAWQTIIMEGALISADIAEFLLPMFGDDEIYVPHFDTSHIAVLQETETLKWTRESTMVDVVITRNEWRQGRGLKPVEGGDKLYIATQSIPIDAVGQALSPIDVPLIGDGDENEEPVGEEEIVAVPNPNGASK